MKKLILGILFAIALIGCGDSDIDNDLYTSNKYKQDLVKRIWADDSSYNYEAGREYWDFLEKLSKEKGRKAEKEIKLWQKAMRNRFSYTIKLREKEWKRKEKEMKRKRLTVEEWKEIQEYKNSLSAPLIPDE